MIKKIFWGTVTLAVSWLAMSYFFFPIKLYAPPFEYFMETVTHMAPLKAMISIVFVLLSVFICEQAEKKQRKAYSKNISPDTEREYIDK